MPRPTIRPTELADAAVSVLATSGIHRLTHRTVDTRAEVPEGTTSNHFRSRSALLEAAARRLLAEHEADLHAPAGWLASSDVPAVLAALVDAREPAVRRRYLAYYELMLEATREPRLGEVLRQVRGASVERIGRLLDVAGLAVPPERLDWLASALTGLALDRLALQRPEGPVEPRVEALLRAATEPA